MKCHQKRYKSISKHTQTVPGFVSNNDESDVCDELHTTHKDDTQEIFAHFNIAHWIIYEHLVLLRTNNLHRDGHV